MAKALASRWEGCETAELLGHAASKAECLEAALWDRSLFTDEGQLWGAQALSGEIADILTVIRKRGEA